MIIYLCVHDQIRTSSTNYLAPWCEAYNSAALLASICMYAYVYVQQWTLVWCSTGRIFPPFDCDHTVCGIKFKANCQVNLNKFGKMNFCKGISLSGMIKLANLTTSLVLTFCVGNWLCEQEWGKGEHCHIYSRLHAFVSKTWHTRWCQCRTWWYLQSYGSFFIIIWALLVSASQLPFPDTRSSFAHTDTLFLHSCWHILAWNYNLDSTPSHIHSESIFPM